MRWHESWRADPSGKLIADGHYSRQNRESAQFVPPGRDVTLVIPTVAYWVTSWPFARYVKHAWPGAWVCSAFRAIRRCNACGEQADNATGCADHPGVGTHSVHRSSELIAEAVAATRWHWSPPEEGMITFVDADKTRPKRDPGRCFLRAGFHRSRMAGCSCSDKPSETDGGLVALHLSPDAMPAAPQPVGAQSLMVFA